MTYYTGRLIDHVHLRAKNFEKTRTFYEAIFAVLGFTITTSGEHWFQLDELYVEEPLHELLGSVRRLPVGHYPQAIALALALRHSWRRDDFCELVEQLGIGRNATDIDARALGGRRSGARKGRARAHYRRA